MASATVTSKGQITIPKSIRERLGLEPGDKVEFVVDPTGQLILRPRTLDFRNLEGVLYREGREAVSVEEMRAALRKRSRERK